MQMRLKVCYFRRSFIRALYLDHARTSTIFSTKNLFSNFFQIFFNENMQIRLKAYWTFDDLSLVPQHQPFIHFGNYVLRQIKGVPMGAIPSPDLASLSLSVDEYRFVSEKLKVKAFAILRKMNQVCRYLDDIGVPNFTDFDQYLADIYRGNLTILKSNDNSVLNVAYLDLSINVLEQDFVMKVYCKTDEYTFEVISLPFLESNVDEGMCYSVYFSQILRFIRICSRKDDFIERSKLLSDMLMARGYLKGRLSTKLNQVLSKYQQDWAKFGSGLLPHELTRRILYN